MFLTLAYRNAVRGGWRCILAAFAAALGAAAFIFLQGLVDGISVSIIRMRIETELAHLTIHGAGYGKACERETDSAHVTIPARGPVGEILARHPSVKAVAPRLVFSARLNDGRNSVVVRAVGFRPAQEVALFPWHRFIARGEEPSGEGKAGCIWIGERLLALLEADVGDRLNLAAFTPKGVHTCLEFTVAGAIRTGNPAVDNYQVFLPLAVAQDMLELPGRATEWILRCRSQRGAYPEIARALRGAGDANAALEYRTWLDKKGT